MRDQPTLHAPGHVYEVAIIGAGIAGCEAAWHCARAGVDVLLVTTSLDTLYNLLGDKVALDPPEDTLMARVLADLQGSAQPSKQNGVGNGGVGNRGVGNRGVGNRGVGNRVSNGVVGNWAFHRRAKTLLETETSIHLLQSNVTALVCKEPQSQQHQSEEPQSQKETRQQAQKQVTGVRTWEGVDRLAKRTALCVGSFLHARLTIGTLTEVAGRLSEMAYDDLADNLLEHGLTLRDAYLKASFNDSSLPYQVACQVLDDSDGYQLAGFVGLYAAGVCQRGYLPFEEAALEGKRLADQLIHASQASDTAH